MAITLDLRLGGNPRYLLGDNWQLMRVPDEIRKCVCFLACRKNDQSEVVGGTAFFVSRRNDEFDCRFNFIVTAKHCIDQIRALSSDGRVLLRVNTKGGATVLDSAVDDWLGHPTDPDVDVAVLGTGPRGDWDHLTFPLESGATPDIIKEYRIGAGTDVFITGLFVHHVGRARNIPIVRLGAIAAMPEEKVRTKTGDMHAYLIESRSIGGLSGSPVFAQVPPVYRTASGQGIRVATGEAPPFFLLGLVHGHFDVRDVDLDAVISDADSSSKVNAGIAIVVPLESIMEVLDQPSIKEFCDAQGRRFRASKTATPD